MCVDWCLSVYGFDVCLFVCFRGVRIYVVDLVYLF